MSKRILIADDDPGVTHLLEKKLKQSGYSVLVVDNGLDAIVLTRKEMPDLVVLDVMMPEINGYDVCFELKFDENYRHIPIILLTIRNRELSLDIGKKAGIEYIRKPVEVDLVLEKVKSLLGDK